MISASIGPKIFWKKIFSFKISEEGLKNLGEAAEKYALFQLDRRFGTPACSSGGYPLIRRGSRGNYVCIAQDDLNTLGYKTGGLDGVFGAQTESAVRRYQTSRGLTSDGIIGCNTWRSLQENVVGTGKTSPTIN